MSPIDTVFPASSPSRISSPAPRAGISAFGVKLPSLALPVSELARIRGVEPEKYTAGLGCGSMALCAPGQGVAELATEAARRALAHWRGDRAQIGLLAVGTESALDMSRPLSAWVAEGLGLSGAIRSYEVKHACYGGTLALRQAAEWVRSGAFELKAGPEAHPAEWSVDLEADLATRCLIGGEQYLALREAEAKAAVIAR